MDLQRRSREKSPSAVIHIENHISLARRLQIRGKRMKGFFSGTFRLTLVIAFHIRRVSPECVHASIQEINAWISDSAKYLKYRRLADIVSPNLQWRRPAKAKLTGATSRAFSQSNSRFVDPRAFSLTRILLFRARCSPFSIATSR